MALGTLMTVTSPRASARYVNLTFHGVGPLTRSVESGEREVWISNEQFTAVLDAVRDRPDVRLTFDDGNASDLAIGLPALRERGLTATFFVLAGRLEEPGFLSAEDVALLVAEGMTIGTHGMQHRSWRTLSPAELHEELVLARQTLEDVAGRWIDAAAIPFGRYDRRILSALRRRGYERVFTSDGGPADANRWLQPRTSLRITHTAADLEAILSPPRSSLHGALRSAKLTLKRWR